MKKFFILAMVTLSFNGMLITSCKKSYSAGPGFIQAKVNDSLVSFPAARLSKGLSGELYGVEYSSGSGLGFKLLFPIGKGKGTYTFLSFTSTYQNEGWFQYDYNRQYKSTSGSVAVTEATDKKFSGTFSFSAKSYAGDTKNITEGAFEVWQ